MFVGVGVGNELENSNEQFSFVLYNVINVDDDGTETKTPKPVIKSVYETFIALLSVLTKVA